MREKKELAKDPRLFAAQCNLLIPVETVHENPWFSVCNRKGYFTIEYNQPQVLILPIVDNKSIVMARVIRPIIADNTLELPAGGVRNDESPVEAAARELAEETGIEIRDLNRFKMLAPLVHMVRSPTLPYIFNIHLTHREFNNRKVHDNEVECVECFFFDDIIKMIANGNIYIGLHIAIIVRYFMQSRSVENLMGLSL